MKNYAEELAYWYFRFNGFFPITNFVTHPIERDNEEGYSDTDIIAIKPVGVRETVGLGRQVDFCDFLYDRVINHYQDKTIAIICEVKAGTNPNIEIDNRNIYAQMRRLGTNFNLDHNGDEEDWEILLDLRPIRDDDEPRGLIYEDASIVVYRFLCKRNNNFMNRDHSWEMLTINTMIKFMTSNRFEEYDEKARGWHQYDSSLIQFLLRHPDLIVR